MRPGERIVWCALAIVFISLGSGAFVLGQSAPKPHRKPVLTVEPQYPAMLKSARFEGVIRLAATVLPNGNVSKVEVKGGNPMLCQYASQAVMRWKYAPGPTQTVEDVIFNFHSDSQ